MTLKYSKFSTIQKFYTQWLTGIGVTVIIIEVGIMCGWSSPYLARLTASDSPLPITSEQAAWIASLLNFGRFLGAIFGAITVNYFGSKKSLLLSIVPISLCWIFTIFAKTYIWLYIARASGGFGLAMTYSCFALYVGEVALPEIRGALISLAMSGGGSVGVLVSSVCGSYLMMDESAVIYLSVCILVILLFIWLPDSPHWLVKVGDYDKAKESIAWYQPSVDSEKELEIVKNFVASSCSESFYDKVQKLKSVPIRRAIILIIVLFTFMQITGFNSIIFYMETILTRSNITLIDPATVVILVNASGILASGISMSLIDRCGRKFLLMVSSIGIAIAMGGLGANSYLIKMNPDFTKLDWLPVTSIFIFIIAYYIGLMCVPSAVLGEIFPSDVKCVAGCIASLVGAIWSFVATRSFQPMIDCIGETYVFWMHGFIALLLIPYVCLCMPETKGKSLQDIQNTFMK